ncbi:CLUMA_CG011170, isoform A, partial [Clunio marinus]
MMRSGTSEEQLLEHQQQQELELIRIAKLRELEKQKQKFSERKFKGKNIREHSIFYTTVTLVFFSVSAGASILFLVPLYVDPALSTLAGDFIERPTLCVTTRREDLTGLLNCSWSSCREGCTSDVFKCTHIFVQFVELIDENVNFTFPYNATIQELANFTTELEKATTESVLQVNIKGCGYPPTVKCSVFTETYGFEGAAFPCYYSKKNKTVVMTSYNRDTQLNTIIHFFIVPFIITVISSIGICIIHCNCQCKKERPKYRRPR